MMELVGFKKAHIAEMLEQEINADVRAGYTAATIAELEAAGAMTVMVDGVPMVCGGAVKKWEGTAYVWTLFDARSKHCFLSTLRGIRAFLKLQLETFMRLEMAVPVDFASAHRRAILLGFKMECKEARFYLPSGEHCSLYSMVRQ